MIYKKKLKTFLIRQPTRLRKTLIRFSKFVTKISYELHTRQIVKHKVRHSFSGKYFLGKLHRGVSRNVDRPKSHNCFYKGSKRRMALLSIEFGCD